MYNTNKSANEQMVNVSVVCRLFETVNTVLNHGELWIHVCTIAGILVYLAFIQMPKHLT